MAETVRNNEVLPFFEETGELDLGDPAERESFQEYSAFVDAIKNGQIDPAEASRLLTLREKRIVGEDRFTGVGNKISFTRDMRQIDLEGRRHGKKRTVLFIDGNDFGAVNKKHGTGTGDDVIQTLAESLKSSLRETDQVYRFGGDEFAVILDENTDLEGGIDATIRLQEMIETAKNARHTELNGLTISTGIAQYDPTIDANSRNFFDRLERAQREAKTPIRDNNIGVSWFNPSSKKIENHLLTNNELTEARTRVKQQLTSRRT